MTKFADFSEDQFNALVQAKVAEALSGREEEARRKELEAAIAEANETFTTLKSSMEEKDAKIKEYEEVLADLSIDPTTAEVAANDKIVALEASVEEWKRRADVAEAALNTLALEEAAASRMAELEESGVALDGDDAQVQYVKIRPMSEDEFGAYKNELVALKTKYSSASEETETLVELSELSSDEISLIAQVVGCDPSDSKCISLVRDVALKMAEVSKSRRGPEDKADDTPAEKQDEVAELKETASAKTTLSWGEALSRAVDQKIQASASIKEQASQEWVKLYDAKKQNETK